MKQEHCNIRRLFNWLLEYKRELLKGNISAILATLLTVAIPLFIPILVDELLLKKSDTLISFVSKYIMPMSLEGYVFFFFGLVVILRGLSFLLNVYQVKTFMRVSKDIAYRLRRDSLNHLKRVSLKEYELSSSGAIASKLVSDISTIDNFIGVTVSKLFISSLTLIFTAIVLLIINWKLALFILVTNPLVVLFSAKLARNVGKLKRKENSAIELFQSSLIETLELFSQIRATNKEELFFTKVEDRAKELKERSIDFSYKSDRAMRLSFLVFLSGYELFRSVSILVVAYGGLSIGLMLAVFGYLWIMMTPTQDLINFHYALASARVACSRVDAIFNMELEPDIKEPINPFKEAVSIELKDIRFSYSSKREILKGVSLKIDSGSKVAVVGPSGSGKTTLSNLIVGFYPPNSGVIYYNNTPHTKVAPQTIRENIHTILQNPKLFNDTLLFNLTLGKSYSKEELERAIKIAQLKEVVDNLSDGLNSKVGQDGIRLSGGQRQRVAIARMVLLNPKVVIFDESTSALDIHTETKLFKDLEEYLKPKTVITIAHRLSTIEKAEYIFILEDGKLVDSGKPEELMKKEQGYFAQMV